MADDQLRVLIASPLEPRHVARIEAANPRVSVLYEPGLLPFAKGMPALAGAKAARHWQRYAGSQVAGSRALLVGLGGAGRAVARLLAAAGVEVYGAGRPGRRYDVPGVASYLASDELHQ